MFYSWSENWNGGGLRNAAMFIGISLGFLPVSLRYYILTSLLGILLILFQRYYIETKRYQKEQKYIWKTAEALEDFKYKGKVKINNNTLYVYTKEGKTVRKN